MSKPDERVPEVPVETLRARLSGDGTPEQGERGAQVVDVREDWEWARGHIVGAAHIPLGQLTARLGELDPDRDLYFVCHLGGRSEAATRFARERGLARATNVRGGMDAWESRGYPVTVAT